MLSLYNHSLPPIYAPDPVINPTSFCSPPIGSFFPAIPSSFPAIPSPPAEEQGFSDSPPLHLHKKVEEIVTWG